MGTRRERQDYNAKPLGMPIRGGFAIFHLMTDPGVERSDAAGRLPSRRFALAVIGGGVAALVTGALGLAAGFLSNAFRWTRERSWIRIGPAEDLDASTFRPYVVHVERMHAWVRERVPLKVYVKDLYPADPTALLSTCSHLGCSVSWKKEDGRFRCPCHGGVYDEMGQVVEGPPPRPLTRLEVKIEEDVCYVRLPSEDDRSA